MSSYYQGIGNEQRRYIEAVDAAADLPRCDSCGKSELDGIKLTECADCKSVQHCSDTCQNQHRPRHEAECKERAAELRNEMLFKQPECTHLGDCPICCLPLPLDPPKSSLYPCCSKLICIGCAFADELRQKRENMQRTCPFCRHPLPTTKEEANKIRMKRVAGNDPVAMREMGVKHYDEGDYDGALKYWTKAAELGSAHAHYGLSLLYMQGHGVEKDEKKEVYHMEEAAIQGNPNARHNLGAYEVMNDRDERAVKHGSSLPALAMINRCKR